MSNLFQINRHQRTHLSRWKGRIYLWARKPLLLTILWDLHAQYCQKGPIILDIIGMGTHLCLFRKSVFSILMRPFTAIFFSNSGRTPGLSSDLYCTDSTLILRGLEWSFYQRTGKRLVVVVMMMILMIVKVTIYWVFYVPGSMYASSCLTINQLHGLGAIIFNLILERKVRLLGPHSNKKWIQIENEVSVLKISLNVKVSLNVHL